MGECVICGEKNAKKIIARSKQGYGYIDFDKFYLCNKCIDTCSKNKDIIWKLLQKRGKIKIKIKEEVK